MSLEWPNFDPMSFSNFTELNSSAFNLLQFLVAKLLIAPIAAPCQAYKLWLRSRLAQLDFNILPAAAAAVATRAMVPSEAKDIDCLEEEVRESKGLHTVYHFYDLFSTRKCKQQAPKNSIWMDLWTVTKSSFWSS